MRNSLLLLLLTATLCTSVTAAEPLHRREVNEKNPGGKDLVMTFEEQRREERTSTVKVTHLSGASVPSSMFELRGCYDIARARGAAYFIMLKEWKREDGARMRLIGFAPDKQVDLTAYFKLTEPLPKSVGLDLGFMAVKDFDVVFKDQK